MLLRMHNITKRYPGVRALDGVTFDLDQGEVHCLVGENGAGKSTLMKILAGATKSDDGTISIDNQQVQIPTPAAAQALGIGIIYQDMRQVPELSVAENIFLGHEPVRRSGFIDVRTLHADAVEILASLGESIDPTRLVRDLTIAQRQIVEIARALSRKIRIIVFDEPTASLTGRESENLFRVIRSLKSSGVGVVYISHRIEEILQIADRITVLRDGRNVTTARAASVTTADIIRWMVGRELHEEFPRTERSPGEELLRVTNLTTARLHGVSFSVRRGEVFGIAGLVGAGRSEIARAIFGADRLLTGEIVLEGTPIYPRSPREAIAAGIGLLTEDRNNQGLFLQRAVRENITIANLRDVQRGILLDRQKEKEAVGQYAKTLRLRPADPEVLVETLSGGNRQKAILARWLFTRSKLLFFDEPTVGIDVGVKYEIYVLINDLAKRGIGVVVISSDLNELLGICDTVAVMCDGRMTGILERGAANRERVMDLATSFN